MAESNNRMVASLNFKTTNCCCAFSTRYEFMKDPLKINILAWYPGIRFLSQKTPARLLLDINKEFVAFGYDAEDQYAEFLDNEKDDYYYFYGFTMLPHSKKNVTGDMIIKDVTGKILPAFDVLKLAIKHLVSHLMDTLEKRGAGIGHDEVKWVLTIPSFWTGTATEIMELSAEWAGIQPNQLVLVPNIESACVYGGYLANHKFEKLQCNLQNTKDRSVYMVVYLGGFAADITVLNYKNGQQMYHTTGNDCGGRFVNKQFYEVLDELIGKSAMKSFRDNNPLDYMDIESAFEHTKRSIDSEKAGKIILNVPIVSLDKICHEHHKVDFHSLLKMSKYASNIRLTHHKMRIDADTFRNMFKSTIDNVISLMEKVFIKHKFPHDVTNIVMVGGFSECSLVKDAINRKFPSKRFIIAPDASMSAMIGAVLCGHQPQKLIRTPSNEAKAAQFCVSKCIFCDNPGIYHCTECKSAFCHQCRTKHDRLPTTKTHRVTDLKNINPSAFSCNAVCVSHKSEFIYFCTQCHVLICGKCVTTEHKGHDITDIKTVADSYRRRAEKNISELKETVTKLSQAGRKIKEIDEPNIKRTSETAVSEIDKAVEKITKAVFFTKEKKLDEVHSQLDIEIEEFQYDLRDNERMYEHQKNICESLERLMPVSHDITFITSYETLKRDIHDISDFVGTRGKEKVYKFDKKGFVQEVINAFVSDFEMCLVGKEDGSVVLMHKTDIKKKEKEKKQK